MASRHDRNGFLDRVDVREGARQLQYAGQALFQDLLAEMVELEQDVVAFGAATALRKNLEDNRTSDDVATGNSRLPIL